MIKIINDFDLKGKRVIIRVDFNVPIKNGEIGDDTRIKESLKTFSDTNVFETAFNSTFLGTILNPCSLPETFVFSIIIISTFVFICNVQANIRSFVSLTFIIILPNIFPSI